MLCEYNEKKNPVSNQTKCILPHLCLDVFKLFAVYLYIDGFRAQMSYLKLNKNYSLSMKLQITHDITSLRSNKDGINTFETREMFNHVEVTAKYRKINLRPCWTAEQNISILRPEARPEFKFFLPNTSYKLYNKFINIHLNILLPRLWGNNDLLIVLNCYFNRFGKIFKKIVYNSF